MYKIVKFTAHNRYGLQRFDFHIDCGEYHPTEFFLGTLDIGSTRDWTIPEIVQENAMFTATELLEFMEEFDCIINPKNPMPIDLSVKVISIEELKELAEEEPVVRTWRNLFGLFGNVA